MGGGGVFCNLAGTRNTMIIIIIVIRNNNNNNNNDDNDGEDEDEDEDEDALSSGNMAFQNSCFT